MKSATSTALLLFPPLDDEIEFMLSEIVQNLVYSGNTEKITYAVIPNAAISNKKREEQGRKEDAN
jgi:hypothetical protein